MEHLQFLWKKVSFFGLVKKTLFTDHSAKKHDGCSFRTHLVQQQKKITGLEDREFLANDVETNPALVGGFEPTHLKNMRPSNWIISPRFGVKRKNL